jgi:ADP-heptose:LPS heptosyltransferase
MRLSAMGDVAMTVPVLRAFVNQYPEVRLTIISRPFFKPFFDGIPNVTFFVFDEKNQHKGIGGLIRLVKELNKSDIDAFADLHNVLRSKIVRTLLSLGGKKTAAVNKGRVDKKALTRSNNKVFRPLMTMFERHALVFQELGFPLELTKAVFPKKRALNPSTQAIIGSNYQKLIGIAPFAQYNTKVYPLDLMEKVIVDLAKEPNHKIVLFGGGKKEISILEALTIGKDNVISLAGKLQMKQELDVISNLDVMVSMDSGNGHLAAMEGVPVISLWGATHPFAGFTPFNQPLSNSLTADRVAYPLLPTSIYGNKIVAGYEHAMRSISPQSVVQLIKLQLK